MNRWPTVFSTVLLSAGLVACGSDISAIARSGAFRVANAISDSPTLDASPSGIAIDQAGSIAYGSVGAIAEINEGRYTVNVTPSDASKKFSISDVDVDDGEVTTVFVTGTLASNTQGGFSLEQALTSPAEGQIAVQVVNADKPSVSSTLSTFSFSFTPVDGASAPSSPQTAGVTYEQAAEALGSGGTYRVRIMATPTCTEGNACPAIVALIYDSGVQGITLPATTGASVYQLAAIDAGSGKVALLVIDNTGHSSLVPSVPTTQTAP